MSYLQNFADSWLNLFSIHMLEVSLFIFLVWATDKIFRLDIKLRYFLWGLALIKIFIPPILSLPASIQDPIQGQIPLLKIGSDLAISASPTLGIPISIILFTIWVISAFILACFVIYKNLYLRRQLRESNLTRKLDISALNENLQLYESTHLKAPVLMGLLRPRLYLPCDWSNWPKQQLNSIIEHEKAHIRNRDIFVLCTQYLGLILFWINPLVWLVHIRLNQLRELLCDEFAIQQTGIAPVAYSKLIVRFLENTKRDSMPMFLGKYFSKNTKTIFNRINHLLNLGESAMKTKKLLKYGLPAVFIFLIFTFSWRCSDKPLESTPNQNELQKTEASQFDEPPTPIGGFKAIQENLKYPEIARKAGIEGRVIVHVLISEDGKVADAKILESLGDNGCDEAAMNALKSVEWQPAKQGGKAVKVWVAVPILFKLRASQAAEKPPKAASVPPPAPPVLSSEYDEPPTPKWGFRAIQENLKYPEIARKAGIEGRVVVQILISKEGKVLESKIRESLGNNGCDEAAVEALRRVEWKPAMKDGKPIEIRVSIPVIFKLS